MQYEGKRVMVVGMARSGVAAAQLLHRHGAIVTVNDSKTRQQLGDVLAPLEGLPLTWALGCPAAEVLPGQEVLVLSPGVPDSAPFVREAREAGVYVIGEVELAYQLAPGDMVAVTGTNGKTTTVSLLGEIFRNAGKVTHVVGNIGYPYSLTALTSRKEDVIVCEISSFQMETADTFRPRVAALLNITEDHLNRHGDMATYTAMKMRIFRRQGPEDVAVFNADDPALAPLIPQAPGQVMLFSRKQEVKQGAFVREGKMILRWQGEEKPVCDAVEVRIPGPHNLENALAAACVAAAMGVPAPVIRHSLRTFPGVEHRIEFVRELDGVRYINDSKGTNVDSTIKAVQTMTRPTAIILGGYDKHCDFTPMVKEMLASPWMKEAVLMGVTAEQIDGTLRKEGFPEKHIHRAATLEEAISLCRSLSQPGWNVLLSPACASFDMFADYEARGRIFKELVNALN